MTDAAALARALYNEGKFPDAARIAAQVIAAQPQHAGAHYIYGLALDRQNQVPEARAALEKAVTLAPAEPSFRAALAYISHKAGWNADAIKHGEQVLRALPADQLTLLTLADAQALSGDISAAARTYNKVLESNPGNVIARVNVARLESLLGRPEAADAHLTAALKLAPGNADVTHVAADLALLKALRGASLRDNMAEAPTEMVAQLNAMTPPRPSGTSVVFFHIAQDAQHPIQRYQGNKVVNYIELLERSVAAARLAIPGCRTVLLTDADSAFPEMGLDLIARLPARREWIMYERMRMQAAYAASSLMTDAALFLDTDLLINRDFADVFAQDFDVGLTWRVNPLMPINGGMILGKKGTGLTAFFAACLGAYEALQAVPEATARYGFDVRSFQGDQLALAAAVDWQLPPPALKTVGEARVMYFPCEQFNYNFSPLRDPRVLADKYAVHFKGGAAKAFAADFLARKQAVR